MQLLVRSLIYEFNLSVSESLLHSIQNEAIDGSSDLESLLRKCRVLAQRLSNEDLKHWVVCELNGYPADHPLPEYRILRNPILIGDYIGPMNTGLQNVQIPVSAVKEEYRDSIVPVRFYDGVAQLEADIRSTTDSGFLNIAIPPEAKALIKYKSVADHLVLATVQKVIASSVISGILSNVRNRILNFTLELEESAPMTGDPLKSLKENQPNAVQQIFTTQIMGGVNNFNQGGGHVSQNVTIAKGDIQALKSKLIDFGFGESETNDFAEAVLSESPNADGSFRERVAHQIGKAIRMAGEGALKIPSAVCGSVLAELVKNYYGL